MSGSHPIDPGARNRLHRQGGERLVTALAESFTNRTPARLAGMRTALATGELETLAREAHTFRTTCLTLGAEEMGSLCARLEEAAREQGSGMMELIEELAREFERARPDVEVWKEGPPR